MSKLFVERVVRRGLRPDEARGRPHLQRLSYAPFACRSVGVYRTSVELVRIHP